MRKAYKVEKIRGKRRRGSTYVEATLIGHDSIEIGFRNIRAGDYIIVEGNTIKSCIKAKDNKVLNITNYA